MLKSSIKINVVCTTESFANHSHFMFTAVEITPTPSPSLVVNGSRCKPPDLDPDCPVIISTITLSSLGFTLSLISVIMITTYICVRVYKRKKKKKLRESKQGARTPTAFVHSYTDPPSTLVSGCQEAHSISDVSGINYGTIVS